MKSSYDDAVAAKHTHDNKTILDDITAEKVEVWNKAEENIQSDWNETDDTADGFIKNKPIIPDITGLATETYVDNKIADYTKTVDLADVATTGSYNDLADKPTIPSLDGYAKTSEIPTKVSELENDSNYLSSIPEEYVTDTELEAKGYLTEHQDLSAYATKDEIPTVPSKVSELTNDSNYQTAEQVNSTVTTEIAKVVADAPEDFNTLKEMSDWIAGHENDASAMNSAILDNKTAIASLQTGKADKSEIPTVGNGTVTIKQAGTSKGTFTMNQTGNTTIELTDTNTKYSEATTSSAGLMSATDKTRLNNLFQLTTYTASRNSLNALSDYTFTISQTVPSGYTTVGIVAFNIGNTQLAPIRTGWDTGNVYLQVHNTHSSAISSKFTVSVTVLYIRKVI